MRTLVRNNRPIGWLGHSHATPFNLLDEVFGGSSYSCAQYPAVNISEQPDKYSVELSSPGFSKENFKLEVVDGNLIVTGERKEETKTEDKKFSRREFNHTSFRKSFTLSEDSDDANITANYENGILNISIPKKEAAKAKPAREIKVG